MPKTPWRKSIRSQGGANNCVEARQADGQQQIRDSKLAQLSPVLNLDRGDFEALIRRFK